MAILHYKTGHYFFTPSTVEGMKKLKKFNEGPSLVDKELTSTKDLPDESDALVTTNISKSHYTFSKPLAARVDQFRPSQDNIMLAVKRLPHPFEDFKRQRQNFREIRILKNIKGHPNIVSFIRCTMYKNELWLAMECLSGGSLKDLKDRLQLGENPMKFIAHNVLSGLEFLHGRQIGHRGIRSDHLMFSHNGTVKIIDFSQASDFSQGPISFLVGSPWWMSPEMISGQHSLPTDIWSFGITMLELINGLPPHRNCSARAMFVTATRGYPVLPLSKRLRWSAELTDFLHNCLAFEPHLRWTAEKLLCHKFLKSLPSKKEMVELVFSNI